LARYLHLIETADLERSWVENELFELCNQMRSAPEIEPVMQGRALYCLFYEPSFLTRTSFERAVDLLGGEAYHTEDAAQFFPVHRLSYIDNIINILGSLRIDIVVLRAGDDDVVARF